MKLSQVGELPLLEMLRKRFSAKAAGLVLGIGDDAAVIRPEYNTLLTTDMMVEGVHFDLSWTTPLQLGFKLVSVNVSDIYAMGGRPRYVLLDFSASRTCTTEFFDRFFDGVDEALKTYGISLIGGDISAADRIMLSITAIGSAKKVVRRRGARVGDLIYVTGTLGDAACGLELLKTMNRPIAFGRTSPKGLPLPWHTLAPLARRHLMPLARDPVCFASRATAMIDISDGLLIDLSRLCRESGVGARIRAVDVPVSDALKKAAAYFNMSYLDFALSGGEDYELLFTAGPKAKVDAVCIGEVMESGMTIIDERGMKMKVSSRGYQHFSLQG
jgi:thiamine-monophosphate kinase